MSFIIYARGEFLFVGSLSNLYFNPKARESHLVVSLDVGLTAFELNFAGSPVIKTHLCRLLLHTALVKSLNLSKKSL